MTQSLRATYYVIRYVVPLMRPAGHWCTVSSVTRCNQKGSTHMKGTTRTSRPATMREIAGQWHQAIQGNDQAHKNLLRRIMPA